MLRRAAILIAVVGASFGAATVAMAAFSAKSANPQAVTAGTLALTTDSASAAFSLSGLTPSSPTVQRCVAVTQIGQPPTNVRLYGTYDTSGTSLAPYLVMKIERGTQSGAPSPSCSGFTPESTAVFDGRLNEYPTSWASGIADAPGAIETWTAGETHSYRISISLANDEAAQGLSSALALTWEAR